MKKELNLVIKLVDFLIRVLTRAIKSGIKTMNAVEKIAAKTGLVGDELVKLNEILLQLKKIKLNLENATEDK